MGTGMRLFFFKEKMQLRSASFPVAVTYIAPCISQTLWPMISWPGNDFLLLRVYLRWPLVHSCFFYTLRVFSRKFERSHTQKQPTPVIFLTFLMSQQILRRSDVWNTHTPADTHKLCWQCVLWVPGSSRGLSCCLDIWLLRQIWLIWEGQESSVQQRTDCNRTSPLVRPPPHTVPGLHPARLKTDQSSGIQMVWAAGEREELRGAGRI